jgi:hypothetical protein
MSILQVINQLEPIITEFISMQTVLSTRAVVDFIRTTPITGLDSSPVETESFHWTLQAIVLYK